MNNYILFIDSVNDWGVFWTAVSTIITILGFIGWLIYKLFIDPVKQENQSLIRENQRLRNDIDTKLQLPSYGLEVVKLSELQTRRKIEEVKKEYKDALKEKDEKLAAELSSKLKEIEKLRDNLNSTSREYSALQKRMEVSLKNIEYVHSGNAIRLPTGFILLIKCNGRYGALKAIDQSWSDRRGAFIKYYWWYQPNKSGIFTTPEVESGFGSADESEKGSYLMKIGPITLPWSTAGEGVGWVYFKNQDDPETTMELVVSDEIDITKINVNNYEFLKPHDGKAKTVKISKK